MKLLSLIMIHYLTLIILLIVDKYLNPINITNPILNHSFMKILSKNIKINRCVAKQSEQIK